VGWILFASRLPSLGGRYLKLFANVHNINLHPLEFFDNLPMVFSERQYAAIRSCETISTSLVKRPFCILVEAVASPSLHLVKHKEPIYNLRKGIAHRNHEHN
jgi:hypothetical protein